MPASVDFRLADKALRLLDKELRSQERKVRLGAAIALSKTASRAREEIQREMGRVFDRPTRYTMNALWAKGATAKGTAPLQASVKIKDAELNNNRNNGIPPVNYLIHQVEGGQRQRKRHESMLQQIGVMPDGWRAVPGEAAKLDRYGNMATGQLIQILSYFQAFRGVGYKSDSTEKTRARLKRAGKRKYGIAYFVAYPGRERTKHLHPGIYMRQYGALGAALRPVLMFVKSASYQPRLDFYGIANRTFDKWIDHELDDAIAFVRKPKGSKR